MTAALGRWAPKLLYLALGAGLLALVLGQVDIGQVQEQVSRVGWGFGWLLAIYLAAFVIDSVTWQLTLPEAPLSLAWSYRLWKIRMVGESFNNTLPAGGFGGEPVKALLLKRHFDIGYRQSAASLILAKTINLMALVVFLAIGFALMLPLDRMPASLRYTAGLGLAVLALAVGLFFLVQRLKLASLTGTWLAGLPWTRGVERVLHHLHDMDGRLVGFYTRYRRRFAWALGLAFANWVLGVAEIYFASRFLGHPLGLGEAWVVEAAAQLVRAGTFFIPASLGAQEGAFLVMYEALAGSATLGFSMALVRRLREITWIVWGFALGLGFRRAPGGGPLMAPEEGPPSSQGPR